MARPSCPTRPQAARSTTLRDAGWRQRRPGSCRNTGSYVCAGTQQAVRRHSRFWHIRCRDRPIQRACATAADYWRQQPAAMRDNIHRLQAAAHGAGPHASTSTSANTPTRARRWQGAARQKHISAAAATRQQGCCQARHRAAGQRGSPQQAERGDCRGSSPPAGRPRPAAPAATTCRATG